MKHKIKHRELKERLTQFSYFRIIDAMQKMKAPDGADQRAWRESIPFIPSLISLKIARIISAHAALSREVDERRDIIVDKFSARNKAGLIIPTLRLLSVSQVAEDRVAQMACTHPWESMLNASPTGADAQWRCDACQAEFVGDPNTIALIEGGTQFRAEEKELLDAETEIDVPLLTMAEIGKLPPIPPGALEPLLQFIDMGEAKKPEDASA